MLKTKPELNFDPLKVFTLGNFNVFDGFGDEVYMCQ
jgi:hypothetical protein